MLSTEDFALHDSCQALRTFSNRYQPLRVSINFALNESLHSAFSTGYPSDASGKMISLGTNPGIDMESGKLYESVIHHSRLVELLATYILAIERPTIPSPISCAWGEFQPRSFLTADGRLRRVVLVDRWTTEREKMERFSWRTAADTALTNRPMVITALVIGASRGGLRPSPWTQGFTHPQWGLRIQKRDGENFADNWRSVYREQTDLKSLEWLTAMQKDGVFEGRVFSVTEDVPPNRAQVLDHLALMAEEMSGNPTRQTRSSCYRFRPCPFLPACASGQSPGQIGWIEKDIAAAPLPVLTSA